MSTADLKKILDYNSLTGDFRWVSSRGTAKAGSVAGSVNHHGYREISIDKVKVQANRLAWFITTGAWPKGVIDHKNRVRDDNRIINLRDISVSLNNLNKGIRSDNKSGLIGVSWDSKRLAWRSTGQIKGKQYHLGYYPSLEAAAIARHHFCLETFGDFYFGKGDRPEWLNEQDTEEAAYPA